MGSFVGHIDEALFFILLSVWWLFRKCPAYIRSIWSKKDYQAKLSHPVLCGKRQVPVETLLKIIFPSCGLVGELVSADFKFIDENNQFQGLAMMLHSSIYSIFIVHGIIDLLTFYRIPLPHNFDYLSALIAFLWYGLSFSYHGQAHGRDMIEKNAHILPINVIAGLTIAGIIEMFSPHLFIAEITRVYGVLVLGTWFFHMSFVMYLPYPWPGSQRNPAWDVENMDNASAMIAMFGFHLIFDFIFVTLVYLAIYFVLRMRGEGRCQFKPLLTEKTDLQEEEC